MITADEIRAEYYSALQTVGEDIVIRLYSGTGGARAVQSNTTVRARVTEFNGQPLVGAIIQGDCKAIVFAKTLLEAGVTPYAGVNCKAVVRGQELQIKSVDANTRRINGELMAFDMVVSP